MGDFLSKDRRSALMSRVRNRGTATELYVRRSVWSAGFRYRLNVRKLPGAPDLVLRRYRTAVLVQGCFWHGHHCRKGQQRPATNQDFWNKKLDGNIARDAANQAELRKLGWSVFVVWECQLSEDTEALVENLNGMRSSKDSRCLPDSTSARRGETH